jgi:hypothetical protein
MFAIPPNNYDFYTEEEKYVLPRRGDETRRTSRRGSERDKRGRTTFLERETKTLFVSLRVVFVFFSPLSPERATKGSLPTASFPYVPHVSCSDILTPDTRPDADHAGTSPCTPATAACFLIGSPCTSRAR